MINVVNFFALQVSLAFPLYFWKIYSGITWHWTDWTLKQQHGWLQYLYPLPATTESGITRRRPCKLEENERLLIGVTEGGSTRFNIEPVRYFGTCISKGANTPLDSNKTRTLVHQTPTEVKIELDVKMRHCPELNSETIYGISNCSK